MLKMNKDLKLLPPPEKKVAAKVLGEEGYSTRQIEELLEIDNVSAWRAIRGLTEPELEQFETDFRAMIAAKKKQGIKLVADRLLQLIPKERRIDQVVKAGEYLEGRGQGANVAIQNNGGGMTIDFS